jgi:hypothetical protein
MVVSGSLPDTWTGKNRNVVVPLGVPGLLHKNRGKTGQWIDVSTCVINQGQASFQNSNQAGWVLGIHRTAE